MARLRRRDVRLELFAVRLFTVSILLTDGESGTETERLFLRILRLLEVEVTLLTEGDSWARPTKDREVLRVVRRVWVGFEKSAASSMVDCNGVSIVAFS
jgi:hypothetical protein